MSSSPEPTLPSDDSPSLVVSEPVAPDPAVPETDASAPAASAPAASPPAAPAAQRRGSLRAGDWQVAAWRSFLRTHTHILRVLEQDLQTNHKIAIASYDVLVQLAEAPGNRLRMSELADAVLLSRSGLTRLVDRLQRDGLVERERDPGDARGLFTVMTPKGRDALRDAAVVHLRGIADLFVDRLAEDELLELQRLMNKLDPKPGAESLPDDVCGIE